MIINSWPPGQDAPVRGTKYPRHRKVIYSFENHQEVHHHWNTEMHKMRLEKSEELTQLGLTVPKLGLN